MFEGNRKNVLQEVCLRLLKDFLLLNEKLKLKCFAIFNDPTFMLPYLSVKLYFFKFTSYFGNARE